MAFEVLRTVGVARTVEDLNKPERRAYHAAVDALRGEGCSAGGKRLMALDGTDVALCQRNLYGAWRMITAYRADASIVIVAIARHTRNENAVRVLAEVFPGVSATGRKRSEQPPCCAEATQPPELSAELTARLESIFGL